MAPWKDRLELIGDTVFSGRFMQQFAALFYKNVLLAWRNRRATALRLFAPFIFLLLALVVNLSLSANFRGQERFKDVTSATPEDIGSIPDCSQDLYIGNRPCVTFLFTPNNDDHINDVVQGIMTNNVPPLKPGAVVGYPTRKDADAWMLANPDSCLGAVHFQRNPTTGIITYILQNNSTSKSFKGTTQDPVLFFQIPLMNAVAREVARHYLANTTASPDKAASLSWAPALVKYPHPALETSSLLGSILAAFIFASLMFGFVTQMSALAGEKQAGLRQALRNMGMRDSSYWASWMAFDAAFALLAALLTLIFGLILQFPYFKKNDPGLLVLLFWLFGLAMTSFSYFLSVFIGRAQTAVYVGFVVFIVGWIFQTVASAAGLPYSPEYYFSPPATNQWGLVFYWIFHLFPWNPLTKGVVDLAAASTNDADPGIRWSERSSYCQYIPDQADQPQYNPRTQYRDYDCIFPLEQVYGVLIIQWVAYFIVAVYLTNVLPNEVGTRRPLWYPFSWSYWRPRPAARAAALEKVLAEVLARQKAEAAMQGQQQQGPRGADAFAVVLPRRTVEEVDGDVGAEEAKMLALLKQQIGAGAPNTEDPAAAPPCGYAAELYGLAKMFKAPRGKCCRGRGPDFWAIKGSWLGIEEGQLFCLLGPNGAGKTTTINCLTGVHAATHGDALVYGESIRTGGGLDRIRSLMGVCPQFDVLWGELSGAEHLWIYGNVKGLPFSQVRQQATELLGKVQLTSAAGLRSAGYSGGMKRRLSVAIALLGDPKIVYLDEPTTGMDPISRRYVWDIIQGAKAGRAIVLTTHSMEEADILGDRIGIMARGRLRALGTSLRLKQKFGAGFQVSASVMPPLGSTGDLRVLERRAEGVKALFDRQLGLQPVSESKAYVEYLVPRDQEVQLVGCLKQLEQDKALFGLTDLQLSETSLEEVFLTIAKQAELEAAAASGTTTMTADLPNGQGTIEVGLGEEEVTDDDTGVVYQVKWAQDDAGRLVVLELVPLAAAGVDGGRGGDGGEEAAEGKDAAAGAGADSAAGAGGAASAREVSPSLR